MFTLIVGDNKDINLENRYCYDFYSWNNHDENKNIINNLSKYPECKFAKLVISCDVLANNGKVIATFKKIKLKGKGYRWVLV